MANPSERQVNLRAGGNFSTLADFFNRRIVKRMPFVNTQELTASAVQFKLIDSSILAGSLAVGTSSVTSGGVVAAEIATAVGTAATTKIQDSLGNILNLVSIRDAVTHEKIVYVDGADSREVYGLLQSSNGVADGTAIAAAASENLQMSFVYYTSACVLTLCAITATIEFHANKLYTQRNVPTIEMESGSSNVDVLAGETKPIKRLFTVTTAYAANEVITLSTGNGAGTGRSTPTGDTITLEASAALFNANRSTEVDWCGIDQIKSVDVIWDSTTTFHFAQILDVGDTFQIKQIN